MDMNFRGHHLIPVATKPEFRQDVMLVASAVSGRRGLGGWEHMTLHSPASLLGS